MVDLLGDNMRVRVRRLNDPRSVGWDMESEPVKNRILGATGRVESITYEHPNDTVHVMYDSGRVAYHTWVELVVTSWGH